MSQVNDLVHPLYADESGIIFQHKNNNIVEHQLNKSFANICDWFVGNKLSIHFGEDRARPILFSPSFNEN